MALKDLVLPPRRTNSKQALEYVLRFCGRNNQLPAYLMPATDAYGMRCQRVLLNRRWFIETQCDPTDLRRHWGRPVLVPTELGLQVMKDAIAAPQRTVG